MKWIIHLLRQHSELAILLTNAIGFRIEKNENKGFLDYLFLTVSLL